MAHTPLRGLRPQSYEHPSDKKTLDVLQSQSGLETLIRKFNEYGVDRLLRVQLMGSYLRATEDSFPELYRAVQEGCQILDVPKRPAVLYPARRSQRIHGGRRSAEPGLQCGPGRR